MGRKLKLNNFGVGDTVVLHGAVATPQPLFIGDIQKNGHWILWNSRTECMAGAPWVVSAAGSHEARRAETR